MKLFVTGLCGRLGRALAFEAAEQGIEIVGINRGDWPEEKVGPIPKGVRLVKGSYTDIELLNQLLPGCEAIIHTAGPHGSYVNKIDMGAFLDGNLTANARMLDVALRLGIRKVMLSSTMEVLVGRNWKASGPAVLSDDSPPRPETAYSVSRLLLEQLGVQYSRIYGMSISSIRYVAFGYGDENKLGLSLLAHAVHSRDAATASILAALRDDLRGEVFLVGPQTPLNNADIVAAMSDPKAVLEKYWPGAVSVLEAQNIPITSSHFWPVTDIATTKIRLGWKPKVTFETWLASNGWKKPSA